METEKIKSMKLHIYLSCMTQPNKLCVGNECPIYDFYDNCHKQYKRGDFNKKEN